MKRAAFAQHLKKLVRGLAEHLPVDSAVDQMASQFIHNSVRPALAPDELRHHVATADRVQKVSPYSMVRLVRKHVARMVAGEDVVVLYFSTENARHYTGKESASMEVPLECAGALETLMTAYPKWVRVSSLPTEAEGAGALDLVTDLYDRGLVLLK